VEHRLHVGLQVPAHDRLGDPVRDGRPRVHIVEQFLANEQRLAANNNRNGQRPPREGSALCQGIVRCGACGGSMTTLHRREGSYYECGHSRADHVNTPGCRSGERCRCRRGELPGPYTYLTVYSSGRSRMMYVRQAVAAIASEHVEVTQRNEALLLEISQVNLELLRRWALR
jgi:uncharacterized protein DUF6788